MLVMELKCVACKRGQLDSEVVVKNYRVEKYQEGMRRNIQEITE
jgi:hypothetical protein